MRIRKRRLKKTILYRISAIIIAQVVTWLFCQRLEVNGIVGVIDAIQTIWYYTYEGLWHENKK